MSIRSGVFLVFLGTFCFSLKSIFIKLAYIGGISPEATLFLRQLIAVPLFWVAFLLFRPQDSFIFTKRDMRKLIFAGILGFFLSPLFDFWGLAYVSAIVERMLLFSYPVFVLLISAFYKNERIQLSDAGALLVIYFGIFLAIGGWNVDLLKANLTGAILVIVSAVMYAFYLFWSGQLVKVIGVIRLNMYGVSIATVFMSFYLFGKYIGGHSVKLVPYHSSVYFYVFLIAALSTVLANLLMFKGIVIIGAERASVLSLIGPVITTLLGAFFLQEQLALIQWAGCGLVFFGTVYMELKKHIYFKKESSINTD